MRCSYCDGPLENNALELHRNGTVQERFCSQACARASTEDEARMWPDLFTPDIPPYEYRCHA